jgi:ligand-binding sensor domain-containing protein
MEQVATGWQQTAGLRHLDADFQNDRSYDFGVNWINITSIVKDTRAGCLWLGTWDQGLIKFIPGTGSYKFYKSLKNDSTSLSSNNTYRLLLDSKGDLWVGTWGGGLHRFDTSREQFEKVQLRIPGLFTTDDQIILTIMQDPSGLLWVGTDGSRCF